MATKDYSQKTLTGLTLSELADIHLDIYGLWHQLADGTITSCVGQLIEEIKTTQHRERSRIFSPLFGSFALLDQIGTCYINKSLPKYPDDNASGVKKALYYFCNFDANSAEAKAIYGLRNSLVHDGSILYRGRLKDDVWTGPFHYFRLGLKGDKIIELPADEWDGDLKKLDDKHRTKINQDALILAAINAVSVAKNLLDNGNLGFTVRDNEIELYYRYLFHYPNKD